MRSPLLASLLVLSAVLTVNAGLTGLSSPLLLWSNRAVVGAGQGQHVSYEVIPEAEDLINSVVLKSLGKVVDGHRISGFIKNPADIEEGRTVVVFVGSQLDIADMRSRVEAIGSLGSLLDGAMSSLVLPYVTSKGASVQDTLSGKLNAAGLQPEVVGCVAPSSNLEGDVASALAKNSGSSLKVVIVCGHVSPAQENTNAGLAAEVQQLQAVQSAVNAAGVGHVVVYASQPKPDMMQGARGKRRSLMAVTYEGFGVYKACGPLCQTQVRWLEGMLAMLFLALASCAGLVCLYVLDTPTRFDAPKEGAQQS